MKHRTNVFALDQKVGQRTPHLMPPSGRDNIVRRAALVYAKTNSSWREGSNMDWKEHGVRIVHAGELDMNTPQTSGMTRAAAITHARTGAEILWAGTMVVQPDAKTGPHHHGELETVLYVVKGRVRMRWGDHLELSEEAGAGDFIYVPPYVPHQEINGSPNEICEAVVVRSGQEPVVINLDVETPEPASAGHPGMPFHPGG
jgi:uncharacterized RmlC-like cupin family protein